MIQYRAKEGKEVFSKTLGRGSCAMFNGQCFRCGASYHMQLQCPTAKCQLCGLYGHEERNCGARRLVPRGRLGL